MKMNILRRISVILLSLLMIAGITTQNMRIANAASYKMEWHGKSTAYGSTVGNFTIDGRRAWCIEHKKTTPSNQTMSGDFYTSTEPKYANIRKIMYYGWFGYQTWDGMNGLSDDEKNVIMSMALSHAYSGTSLKQGKIADFYNYATAQPDPLNQNNLLFSKNELTTYYDSNAGVQKSESVRLNGPNGYHITISTGTDKVKVVNETRNQTGETVDIYGGDTMHYEADASYTGPMYSGYKSGGFTFAPLIIHNGNDKYQHISTWYTIPPEVTTFANAQFQAVIGRIKLRKTDVGGKLLDGAVFHVTGNNYDQDVTVTNGEIVLDNLLVGEYTITEKGAPFGYLVNTSTFSTTVNPGQTSEVTITDEAPTGKIQIEKTDADGIIQGEASLEGAEYTVYDSQKKEVGKITTDKEGHGSLNNLVLGTYTVKETKAPEGYNLDPNTYTVELTYKDQTSSIIFSSVESQDKVKTGYIEILKTDTDNQPLKGGEFGIYTNSDMYIGSTLYKKGQLVMSIKTNEKGIAKSDPLPYGSYYVKEMKAPGIEEGNKENFVLSDETQYVKISSDKVFSMTFVDVTVTASKKDITGSDEIKGAKMQVTDMNGQVIDTWTSGEKPHSIKGLTEGHEYILTEITAPDGYVKAESIKFTVSKDKKNETVVMKDKQVKISKTDLTGKKELKGAHLEVRDEFNKVVDSWTSTDEPHYVSGLEEGKMYTLIEITAPDGYLKAESIQFTVSTDKKNETVVMKDGQITVSKQTMTGKEELEGAKLEVRDESNNIIDSWTSTHEPHYVSGLEEGKTYTLIETTAPDGYVKAESIQFTVSKENQTVVMKDGQVTVSKTTITGKEELEGAKLEVRDEKDNVVDSWTSTYEPHYVSGLEEGKTYTLIETTAPDGYVKAESIQFTVSKSNQTVVMKDASITVNKIDEETEEPVSDAEFSVFDGEGNLIDQWITDGTAHAVSHLEAGKEYTLKETKTPRGYQTVADSMFTVSGEEDLSLEIKEKPVLVNIQVNKIDAKTKQLIKDKDFEFTLYNDPDCIYSIASASSRDGSATFKSLRYGTYYIKETKAPLGYHLSDEVKKVVIDENVEGDTYTFDYENKPIEIIMTGDSTHLLSIMGLCLVSMIGAVFFLIKKRI
ncbi:SpaA isopeptide-forming pilin-related protein [uncultured Catenibacterium sp.]|uniref:SpaA isopeptide-forming pilin-related protein n=2 Tax=uncultured Catenibacterium sp. TaxID=286142 RepID=UPI0025F68AA0|nr:SpaA isopeptide-forming pilin-related protein [uncultured Catenibacterium sp.]